MTNGRSQDRLPPPSSHIPLGFPDGAEASRSLYFWKLKFHFVFFFLSRVFVPFHFIPLPLVWTAVGTSTFNQNSPFFFSWRIHQKCDPHTPVQNPVIPGAPAPVKHSQIFLHSGASGWWRRRVQLLSPLFLASCPFTSPVLSSPLHFWTLFGHRLYIM